MRSYKIFISYAHNDNEEDLYLEDVRFVTDFKNRLEKLLTLSKGDLILFVY